MKRVVYLFLILMLIGGVVFLSTGCQFVQDFFDGGSENTGNNDGTENENNDELVGGGDETTPNSNILTRNFDFLDPNYTDAHETYTDGQTENIKDYIPEWTLAVQPEQEGSYNYQMEWIIHDPSYDPNFDGGADNIYVEMKENATISNGHAMRMDQYFDPPIYVTDNTMINVKFKIIDFSESATLYPHEAPIKLWLKINGSDYLIVSKKPNGNGDQYDPQSSYAPQNEWVILDFPVVGYQISGKIMDQYIQTTGLTLFGFNLKGGTGIFI